MRSFEDISRLIYTAAVASHFAKDDDPKGCYEYWAGFVAGMKSRKAPAVDIFTTSMINQLMGEGFSVDEVVSELDLSIEHQGSMLRQIWNFPDSVIPENIDWGLKRKRKFIRKAGFNLTANEILFHEMAVHREALRQAMLEVK